MNKSGLPTITGVITDKKLVEGVIQTISMQYDSEGKKVVWNGEYRREGIHKIIVFLEIHTPLYVWSFFPRRPIIQRFVLQIDNATVFPAFEHTDNERHGFSKWILTETHVQTNDRSGTFDFIHDY
ncbi:MAG TPA: hypothetical protein VLI92_01195 [Candidatus Saccharimonadales bacterium]|nr:hypothetical protein [Candidatus Saccharimonadales bacterium]